jgi:hypothetical protein
VSFPQISNYNVMDHTCCALYSSWFLHSSCSLWTLKMKVLCYFKILRAHHHSIKSQKTWILWCKGLRTSNITKVNAHWEEMDWDMTTKLSGLNQKIVHLWHIVAGNFITFHFWS